MGGYGSGWHGGTHGRPDARATVGEARRFTLRGMRPFIEPGERLLAEDAAGVASRGVSTWRRGEAGESSLGFYVVAVRDVPADADGSLVLTLTYAFPAGDARGSVALRVPLARSRVHGGGVRYWMRCPACDRRCGVLYLVADAQEFRCRRCHRLTYESCRESRRYDSLFRRLALQMGTDASTVKRVLLRG